MSSAQNIALPETYPSLKDPFEGKAGQSIVGELTTYGVSTPYTPVSYNSTTGYGMDGLMSTIKAVAQGIPTYRFMNTIQLNY
jgi:hypothetical protein